MNIPTVMIAGRHPRAGALAGTDIAHLEASLLGISKLHGADAVVWLGGDDSRTRPLAEHHGARWFSLAPDRALAETMAKAYDQVTSDGADQGDGLLILVCAPTLYTDQQWKVEVGPRTAGALTMHGIVDLVMDLVQAARRRGHDFSRAPLGLYVVTFRDWYSHARSLYVESPDGADCIELHNDICGRAKLDAQQVEVSRLDLDQGWTPTQAPSFRELVHPRPPVFHADTLDGGPGGAPWPPFDPSDIRYNRADLTPLAIIPEITQRSSINQAIQLRDLVLALHLRAVVFDHMKAIDGRAPMLPGWIVALNAHTLSRRLVQEWLAEVRRALGDQSARPAPRVSVVQEEPPQPALAWTVPHLDQARTDLVELALALADQVPQSLLGRLRLAHQAKVTLDLDQLILSVRAPLARLYDYRTHYEALVKTLSLGDQATSPRAASQALSEALGQADRPGEVFAAAVAGIIRAYRDAGLLWQGAGEEGTARIAQDLLDFLNRATFKKWLVQVEADPSRTELPTPVTAVVRPSPGRTLVVAADNTVVEKLRTRSMEQRPGYRVVDAFARSFSASADNVAVVGSGATLDAVDRVMGLCPEHPILRLYEPTAPGPYATGQLPRAELDRRLPQLVLEHSRMLESVLDLDRLDRRLEDLALLEPQPQHKRRVFIAWSQASQDALDFIDTVKDRPCSAELDFLGFDDLAQLEFPDIKGRLSGCDVLIALVNEASVNAGLELGHALGLGLRVHVGTVGTEPPPWFAEHLHQTQVAHLTEPEQLERIVSTPFDARDGWLHHGSAARPDRTSPFGVLLATAKHRFGPQGWVPKQHQLQHPRPSVYGALQLAASVQRLVWVMHARGSREEMERPALDQRHFHHAIAVGYAELLGREPWLIRHRDLKPFANVQRELSYHDKRSFERALREALGKEQADLLLSGQG